MPLRWEFQLFRLDSRPNSACFGRFNHQLIRPDMADTARFAPTRADSAKIEAELVRIEPSGRESEKRKKKNKKSSNAGTDARATVSDAASCVGPCWTWVQHPLSCIRAFQIDIHKFILKQLAKQNFININLHKLNQIYMTFIAFIEIFIFMVCLDTAYFAEIEKLLLIVLQIKAKAS